MTLSKTLKRAMGARKTAFFVSLKQCKKRLDIDYSAFLRRQQTEKKKLVDDWKKRQRALESSRMKVKAAFRQNRMLSRSTEDLRRETSLPENNIVTDVKNITKRPMNHRLPTAGFQSIQTTGRIMKPRAFSRSAEDLQTLFDNARLKHDERWRKDDEFKLPRLQPTPSIVYTTGSSFEKLKGKPYN